MVSVPYLGEDVNEGGYYQQPTLLQAVELAAEGRSPDRYYPRRRGDDVLSWTEVVAVPAAAVAAVALCKVGSTTSEVREEWP